MPIAVFLPGKRNPSKLIGLKIECSIEALPIWARSSVRLSFLQMMNIELLTSWMPLLAVAIKATNVAHPTTFSFYLTSQSWGWTKSFYPCVITKHWESKQMTYTIIFATLIISLVIFAFWINYK